MWINNEEVKLFKDLIKRANYQQVRVLTNRKFIKRLRNTKTMRK